MANKITEIKERVLQIAKYHGVSYEKFSNEIGMSYASFKGKAKFTPLNSDAIANIITIIQMWIAIGFLPEMDKCLKIMRPPQKKTTKIRNESINYWILSPPSKRRSNY